MSATTSPHEEPGTSWSENTTPVSEDIGDIEGIEEVVRQHTPEPASSRLHTSRALRQSAVRRGPAASTAAEPGVPRTINTYEFAPVRSSGRETQRWTLGDQSWLSFNHVADKQSSIRQAWSTVPAFITGEDMDEEMEQGEGSGGATDSVAEEFMGLEADEMDVLIEPKVESPDEMPMVSVQEAGTSVSSSSNTAEGTPISPCQPKRPRGRPRKHPIASQELQAKVAKGRSKTGCITCRKRKKKCDEAKPRCMNCEKNAVLCEGYPERTVWKSGREKAEEGTVTWTTTQLSQSKALIASAAQSRRVSLPNIHLSPVIHGVETPGDRIFFEHYVFRLSAVLTVEGSTKNAFKDMLLPLAVQHLGLMHSILALSSSNIDYRAPYGKALLLKYPDLSEGILRDREEFHQAEALKEFHSDIDRQNNGALLEKHINPARFGQMLCLVVKNLSEGRSSGEHRVHLKAYQNLIRESPPEEGPFMEFIKEYFQFHISLDEVVCLPEGSARLGAAADDWDLPPVVQPEAARLLGVQDGLFFYMSKITGIRNAIRENMRRGEEPVVDYTSLYRAAEIDAGVREWTPSWPEGDNRDVAGRLYKQMIWVYLWRTIYPPKATAWAPDPRITQAVNDGLALLELFSASDPSQTLLLAPTFLIGCAAFGVEQRVQIRKFIKTIKEYTSLRNADRAAEVLEEVWRCMDNREERSWDWQVIAHSMGMDFLAT